MNEENRVKYRGIIKAVGNDPLLIFDIDSTLYPGHLNIEKMIMDEILRYLIRKMNMSEECVRERLYELNQKYGLASLGIQSEIESVEVGFYSKYISKVFEYENYIKPDSVLRNLLNSINIRKICFTNADSISAVRILKRLGVFECFEAVITIDSFERRFICKPQVEAYKFVEDVYGIGCGCGGVVSVSSIHLNRCGSDKGDCGECNSKCNGSDHNDNNDNNNSINSINNNDNINNNNSINNINNKIKQSQKNVLFFDDSTKNIYQANAIGWQTVHINDAYKYIGDTIKEVVNTALIRMVEENVEGMNVEIK